MKEIFVFQKETAFEKDDIHFNWFPDHRSLLQKLQSAKNNANATSSRAYFEWRGIRDFVNPGKTISKKNFLEHLVNALKAIPDITEEEKSVRKYNIKKISNCKCFFFFF